MSYENHINKFSDAAAIQAAIDNGDLLKPYVALDASAGTLDYNTRSVTPPVPPVPTMGEWSIDSDGHYVLTITEHDTTVWGHQTTIGYLNNVYVYSQLTQSVETTLFYDGETSEWYVGTQEGAVLFYDYQSDSNGLPAIATDLASSDPRVNVTWDAVNKTFTFSSGDPDHPLTMTTVNPPYPGSPSESESGSGSGSGQLDEPTPESGD